MSAADCKAARRRLIQLYRPRKGKVTTVKGVVNVNFKKPSGKK